MYICHGSRHASQARACTVDHAHCIFCSTGGAGRDTTEDSPLSFILHCFPCLWLYLLQVSFLNLDNRNQGGCNCPALTRVSRRVHAFAQILSPHLICLSMYLSFARPCMLYTSSSTKCHCLISQPCVGEGLVARYSVRWKRLGIPFVSPISQSPCPSVDNGFKLWPNRIVDASAAQSDFRFPCALLRSLKCIVSAFSLPVSVSICNVPLLYNGRETNSSKNVSPRIKEF